MERTLHLLILGADRNLSAEVEQALPTTPGVRYVVQSEGDLRRGVEIARDREPALVVLDLAHGAAAVRDAAAEIVEGAANTVVIAAYRAESLEDPQAGALLIDVMRSRVRDFLRRPVSPPELADVLRRHLLHGAARGAATGRIVSFVSNKGGIGKSTLAVNTAALLAARHPGRVLLIDTSLQLGVCASMLDLEPEVGLADAARELYRLDGTLLRNLTIEHESGLRLLAAPVDAVAAAAVDEAAISRVLAVARRSFDYVVVDTFPMLDSVAVAILDVTDLAYVVTSGLVPVVHGVARFLDVLDRIGFAPARQRLVLNRCHPRFAGDLPSADVEQRLDRGFDHTLPFERRLFAAANTGRPYVLQASRWSSYRRAAARIVDEIESLPRTAVRSAEVLARPEESPAVVLRPVAPPGAQVTSPETQEVLR